LVVVVPVVLGALSCTFSFLLETDSVRITASQSFLWIGFLATILGFSFAAWQIVTLDTRLERFRISTLNATYPRQVRSSKSKMKDLAAIERMVKSDVPAEILVVDDLRHATLEALAVENPRATNLARLRDIELCLANIRNQLQTLDFGTKADIETPQAMKDECERVLELLGSLSGDIV
jgi:hypothetical protein